MEPYQQGDMDGLCGIYSIINASRLLMKNLTDEDCEKLLRKMFRHVEKKKKASTIITGGIEGTEMENILKEILAKKFAIKSVRPFPRKRKMTIDLLWQEINDFMNGNGGKKSVIIGVEDNECDHWTVIRSINSNQARLFDSSGMVKIYRKECTIGERTKEHPLSLSAPYMFFLFKDKPGKEKRTCSKKA